MSKKKPDALEASLQRLVDERVIASKWSALFSLKDVVCGMADRINILQGRLDALEGLIILASNQNITGQQVIVAQLNAILRKAGMEDAVQNMEINTGEEVDPEDEEGGLD